MYSVDELIDQIDQASDIEDDLEQVVEGNGEDITNDNEATEDNENNDGDDASGSAKKVAKKVRKPSNRPKLDAERLKGPRGLACMEKLFSKIEFQGNGHEKEDLDAVMNTMQYWCHRLFPKYSFDDTLEQLERLGAKKPVMTFKKKILFDMLEEDQPIVMDGGDEVTEEQQEAINEFDLLLQQEPLATSLPQPSAPPVVVELSEEQKEMINRNRQLAAERRRARLEALQQKETNNSQDPDSSMMSQEINTSLSEISTSNDSQLTEEQRQIIEKNRILAIEKRRTLLNQNTSTFTETQDSNSTSDVTNSMECDVDSSEIQLKDNFIVENSITNCISSSSQDIPEKLILVSIDENINSDESCHISSTQDSAIQIADSSVNSNNLESTPEEIITSLMESEKLNIEPSQNSVTSSMQELNQDSLVSSENNINLESDSTSLNEEEIEQMEIDNCPASTTENVDSSDL